MSGKEKERIASEFAKTLTSRTCSKYPELEIKVGGGGSNLYVNVKWKERWCHIPCFPPSRGSANRGIVYLVFLRQGHQRIADGRTEKPEEVLSCITSWVVEQLPLQDLYALYGFIDNNRRSLWYLAEHIDQAQVAAGSDILATFEDDTLDDIRAQLWIYGEKRTCQLNPAEGSEYVQCDFLSEGTVLASAELVDKDAAARSVNLWLDRGLTLEELSRQNANLALTDFATAFERGDVALWSWLKLIKQAREDAYYASYLSILERLFEKPEVNRFFLFTSVGRICFSRCSHYPFATAGMPVISRAPSEFTIEYGDERIQADTDDTVSFVTKRLAQLYEPPFIGCADDLLLEPLNTSLVEQGSPLRVKRIWRGRNSEISVSRGDRTCGVGISEPSDTPYAVNFRTGNQFLTIGWYKTLTGVTGALHMWLEQGSKLEEIAAVADRFPDSSFWPPRISATDSSL